MPVQSHFVHTMSLIGAGVLYRPLVGVVALAGSFPMTDALAYLPPTLIGIAALVSAVSGALDSRAKRRLAEAEDARKGREAEAALRPPPKPPSELVA